MSQRICGLPGSQPHYVGSQRQENGVHEQEGPCDCACSQSFQIGRRVGRSPGFPRSWTLPRIPEKAINCTCNPAPRATDRRVKVAAPHRLCLSADSKEPHASTILVPVPNRPSWPLVICETTAADAFAAACDPAGAVVMLPRVRRREGTVPDGVADPLDLAGIELGNRAEPAPPASALHDDAPVVVDRVAHFDPPRARPAGVSEANVGLEVTVLTIPPEKRLQLLRITGLKPWLLGLIAWLCRCHRIASDDGSRDQHGNGESRGEYSWRRRHRESPPTRQGRSPAQLASALDSPPDLPATGNSLAFVPWIRSRGRPLPDPREPLPLPSPAQPFMLVVAAPAGPAGRVLAPPFSLSRVRFGMGFLSPPPTR